MSCDDIFVGDEVRFSVAFTDIDGDPADPTTVTFRIAYESGTVVEYTDVSSPAVEHDSTGNYHIDLAMAEAGRHTGWFIGDGAIDKSGKKVLVVQAGPPDVNP